ncbi:hypothetical protein N9933_02410 [bacterium]|nr:hypothetical protein [bacterium]
MISRITPAVLERLSWAGYLKEIKQDFLHFKPGKTLQYFFILDFAFAKGGEGPLFIMGSNIKSYWQADELKQLESDYWRTHLHGTCLLLEDKKTIELSIKKGGIIKSNKQVIEIAFRNIFRPLGYGNMRISFKGHTKQSGGAATGKDNPQSLVEKIDYLKQKPKEIALLINEAQEAGVLPEAAFNAMMKELTLARSRNNIHKMVEWYMKIEELVSGVL